MPHHVRSSTFAVVSDRLFRLRAKSKRNTTVACSRLCCADGRGIQHATTESLYERRWFAKLTSIEVVPEPPFKLPPSYISAAVLNNHSSVLTPGPGRGAPTQARKGPGRPG